MTDGRRKIIRNTLTNSASFGFAFISNILLLPFIVHVLGNEYYGGIWVIVGTLTSYIGLIDLGTGTAFVKFISEYYTKGDENSVLEVVNTGVCVYLVVGSLVISIAFLFDESILALVGVPSAIMHDARFVFKVAILIFVFANLVSPVTSVLTGIQRMDINSYVSMVTQTINVASTITVLSMGYGIRGLIINNACIIALTSTTVTYFAFRHVPYLRAGLQYVKYSKVKEFVRYGLNLQVSRLAQYILFQTDRLLTLRLFGTVNATYYDIGAKLNNAARSISSLSFSALVPAFSELDAKNYRSTMLLLYVRGSKYIAVSASFIFMFIFVFASNIIHVWMGSAYLPSTNLVRVLSIGYYCNILTGVASSLAAGMGKTEFERRYGILTSLLNLVAIIAFSLWLGPIGIAVGTTIALCVGAAYFMHIFHSHLRIAMTEIIMIFGKVFLIALISALVTGTLASLVDIQASTRLESLATLSVVFVLYCIFFVVLLSRFKLIDEQDTNILRELIPRKRASDA